MAVISAILRDNKHRRGSENAQGTRTLREVFVITTEGRADEPSTILDDPKSPQKNDPHPTDSSVRLINRDVQPSGSDLKWFMNAVYSNDLTTGDQGGGGGAVNVLKVKGGTWLETVVETQDVNGKPYRNSAGDRIKREFQRPQPLIIISAQTLAPKLGDFVKIEQSVNKNAVSWLGLDFAPTQLMFYEYDFESIGNNTWKEDFVFRGRYAKDEQSPGVDPRDRSKGWQGQILDAGFNELVEVDGDKIQRPIRPRETEGGKESSKTVSKEWPLDGGGGALPRDLIEQSRIFIDFDDFHEIDFGIFQFDFTKILTRDQERRLGL